METYGFDELINTVRNINDGFDNKSTTLLENIADIGVAEIQGRTRVKTGALKRSMTRSEVEGSGTDKKIGMGSNIKYAPWEEDGHRTKNGGFVAGQHMIKDGFTATKPIFKAKCDELAIELMEGLL